jgi:ABC-type nitrate/sulfonate/bicarbonate transport system substrate-binding protein
MAKANGLWKQRGLDVEIRPGGLNIDPLRLVAEGSDDFAIDGADRLLFAVEKGMNLVAVSLELRDNPAGWVVREDSDIREFRDLAGRKVGQKYGTAAENIWRAVLGEAKIDSASIKLVPVQFALDPFLSGTVDALPVYVNEEPFTIRSKGVGTRVLYPSDVGLNFYGNVLITNKDMIEKHPLLVEKFVAGLLEGWKLAESGKLDNVASTLRRVEPSMGSVPTDSVLQATIVLAHGRNTQGEHRFGWMDANGWTQTQSVMTRYAGLSKTINLSACWTNRFVEAYYLGKGVHD